ncbi:cell division protein [Acinetobacter terrae]|jgi:cell division septation protein DedD|uniref:SPOR domain-containing protein n=2 Tax=Acinetobacter terrae TaxID=2731247 RepID=A0A4R0EM71_9GAMM|nr:SPOR domain-containing protein [Acinetobacter terrae]OAL87552.1 cell division protein [Acinetobacter terrae]TCB59284.1 SPOR domain-containing protein [Acinetobacter terrae]
MNSKQRWMGGVVLLGGGVLLTALLLKGKEEIYQNELKTPELAAQVTQQKPAPEGEMVQLQALTVDVETEKRLLEEQRRGREKAVAEQEARAAEFLVMQQQAEADAARKAAEEYAALNAHRSGAQQSSDNIPPELVEDEKVKQKRLADEKLLAQKKLDQQKAQQQRTDADKKAVEDKRKAEADKKLADMKAAEKKASEKKAADEKAKHEAEVKRKAAEKHEAEQKALEAKKKEQAQHEAEAKKKVEAAKKAEAEKARDLLENGDKQWMVQVALAANEANADAVASKLRAKGYKVTKSPTSKGVRIMVGPSKNRDAADAARKKINNDASLGMKSAWVIEWVPLDKR